MSYEHVLRRPASQDEVPAFRRALNAVLDAKDIGPHERFEVVKVEREEKDQLKFARGSRESREAAIHNWPNRETHQHRVLVQLARTPMTDNELEHALGFVHQGLSARTSELRKRDWIEQLRDGNGRGVRRRTSNNRMAAVWTLTPRARARLDGRSDPPSDTLF